MPKNYSIIWTDTKQRYTPKNISIDGYVMLCQRYPEMFENTFVVPADVWCGGV